MRKVITKTKIGTMTSYITTPEEREEARKQLFEIMDRIYERTMKMKRRSKH